MLCDVCCARDRVVTVLVIIFFMKRVVVCETNARKLTVFIFSQVSTSLIRVFAHVLHSRRILFQFYVGFISFIRLKTSDHLFFPCNIL